MAHDKTVHAIPAAEFDALLFDLDGVITETASVHAAAWKEMFDAFLARHADRDLSALTWYTVMACFKAGVILEGSNARAAAGLAPREIGDHLHLATLRLIDRATALIDTL